MNKVSFMGLIALFLSLMPLQSHAQEWLATFLVLTETNGTKTEFPLESQPVVTFEQNNLVVTCNGKTLSTALTDVLEYSFIQRNVTTGINNLPGKEAGKEAATPSFSFHNAEVSGLKEGANVGIYDLNGRLISAVRADAVGHVTLNLSSLPKGIYILRTPTKSFKFVNQ